MRGAPKWRFSRNPIGFVETPLAYHTLRSPAVPALTGPHPDVSFGSEPDSAGDIALSRAGKLHPSIDLRRRDFLVRFCQGAGATLIPAKLWGVVVPDLDLAAGRNAAADSRFQLHPHYRNERPIDE